MCGAPWRITSGYVRAGSLDGQPCCATSGDLTRYSRVCRVIVDQVAGGSGESAGTDSVLVGGPYRAPLQWRGVVYGDVGDIGPGAAAAGVSGGDEGSWLVIAACRVVWRSRVSPARAGGNGSQKHSAR